MPINETLRFDVSWDGVNRAFSETTINDTSVPNYDYYLVGSNPSDTAITEIDIPTYSLASSVGNVNEGDTITFTLTTTMLDTGTEVPYTITGISLADVNLTSLQGKFITTSNGQATLTFTVVADNLTEGTETLVLTLDGKSISKSVTINDTSINPPTYTLTTSADSVNEGSSVTFTLTTTNVPNNTNIPYAITGVSLADIGLSSLTGNFTIQNNTATLSIPIVNDETTEGPETLTLTLTGKSVSKSVTINDTSLTPAPTYVATPNGKYHHKDGPSEFVLAPNSSKVITIYPAGPAPANAEYDGANGGITGLFISDGAEFDFGGWVGASGPSALWLNGQAAAFGNFTYNSYDRNWGGSDEYSYGLWNWGELTGNGDGMVGKSGTYDGMLLTVLSMDTSTTLRTYISGDGGQGYAFIIKVKLTNTTNEAKTLWTMYGEEATEGGYGASGTGTGIHGVRGGTKYHGQADSTYVDRAYKETWNSGGTFVADGYMLVSD